MPWFRFSGEARLTLSFRNDVCELTFANLSGENSWAWVAQKKSHPADYVVLVRCPNVMGLQCALTTDGFEVPAGSPAERIMRAAIKCGKAEELPDDAHWRSELIKTREQLKQRRRS